MVENKWTGFKRLISVLPKTFRRSRKKQENLTIPAENFQPRPPSPKLQGPNNAPAGTILLKRWLKTRKKIRKFQTLYQTV